jgi:Methyltransferase domain
VSAPLGKKVSLKSRVGRTVKVWLPRGTRYAARRAAYRATAPMHKGSAFHCPVCDHDWGRFLGSRRVCPWCCSLGRHRLIMALMERRDLLHGRILHIAPEPGLLDYLREAPVDYWPVDLYPPPGVKQMDITAIDVPVTFSGLIISHVLEHVTDDRRAMAELYRVLDPGAWAIVIVPLRLDRPTYEDPAITTPREREIAYGQWDHVRIYGSDFPDRLRAAGFDVSPERPAGEWSDANRLGLADPPELIYFCHKPRE